MRTASPLRYPGGKSCMMDLTSTIMRLNGLERGHYAEPFAGGCGLALSLLYSGLVAEIHINDLDPAIWSFWHSVLNDTEALIAKARETPVTIDEWMRQRDINRDADAGNPLDLGFSAFFLNRTNRSGIIKGGGVIGGLDQTGNYKIDCRFNVDDLVKRMRRVARYQDRIHLTNQDAVEFLRDCSNLPKNSLLFIDPPYFKKGPGLYTSFYKPEDHAILADNVLDLKSPWVVTYDDVSQIRDLYRDRRQFCFDINYSLQEKRTGTELLIASKGLRMPDSARDRQVNRPQYRAAA
ncbi:DNA adenine methylase [Sphingobium tyrosinilyticum]|uniref:DNA adenine methylase n=1 Tax=Sphingobium tyrosinilyticum TaxID=2715436 RepID=A0ABV9F080_9SPHN